MPDAPFPDDDLAARIRAARAYANKTRRELVAAINRADITERSVARFEDPHGTLPSDDQLAALAEACGVSASFFADVWEAPDDTDGGVSGGIGSRMRSTVPSGSRGGPIVVDGVLSDEKLSELLALGTEYPELDFKRNLDLTDKKQVLELARDVCGMLVRGGYILVGIGDDGQPTGDLDRVDPKQFDDARLTPKLRKWLPNVLTLVTRVAKREGHVVVLIYVQRHPARVAYMQADGTYLKGAEEVFVFRKGDAFWRDGSSTVRMDNRGFEEVIQGRIEDAKTLWLTEQREMRRREQAEFAGASKAGQPLGAVNLDLEQSELNTGVLEFARNEDEIGLQHLLDEALTRARALLQRPDTDAEFSDLLDRLTCLAATLMRFGRGEWLQRVIDTLVQIYRMPVRSEDVERYEYSTQIPPDERAPRVWLEILDRVYALGALAVREERWNVVRRLVLQPATGEGTYYKNWLRQALVTASRAQQLVEHRGGERIELSLLTLARADAARLGCLRSDGISPDADEIMTSLAQFDALYNVVAIDAARGTAGGVFYPSFARFYSHRVTPVVERLLADPEMRGQLVAMDNPGLASALNAIDALAQQVGIHYDGFIEWSATINEFIRENLPPAA
jgi:hypothetical protein